MTFDQSYFEAVLRSSFGTSAIDRGICKDARVNIFLQRVNAPAIFGAAKLHGANDTGSHALRSTHRSRAVPSTSATNFVVIRSIKVVGNISSFVQFYLLQSGEGNAILSTLCSMGLSR